MFEKIKERYKKGYIRPGQLKRYVELEVITPAEYREICGRDYAVTEKDMPGGSNGTDN